MADVNNFIPSKEKAVVASGALTLTALGVGTAICACTGLTTKALEGVLAAYDASGVSEMVDDMYTDSIECVGVPLPEWGCEDRTQFEVNDVVMTSQPDYRSDSPYCPNGEGYEKLHLNPPAYEGLNWTYDFQSFCTGVELVHKKDQDLGVKIPTLESIEKAIGRDIDSRSTLQRTTDGIKNMINGAWEYVFGAEEDEIVNTEEDEVVDTEPEEPEVPEEVVEVSDECNELAKELPNDGEGWECEDLMESGGQMVVTSPIILSFNPCQMDQEPSMQASLRPPRMEDSYYKVFDRFYCGSSIQAKSINVDDASLSEWEIIENTIKRAYYINNGGFDTWTFKK